jgi:multiple sugar transport system substrate-binding protein
MLTPTHDALIGAMLGLIMGACLLSACWVPTVSAATPTSSAASLSDSAQTGQRKIINVWTHMLPGSIEGDVFAKTVRAFEQAQDEYRIEVAPIAPETYADRIIGSAQSGSLPCALEFDGPYLYNFVWSGYLQPT